MKWLRYNQFTALAKYPRSTVVNYPLKKQLIAPHKTLNNGAKELITFFLAQDRSATALLLPSFSAVLT